MREIDDVVIAVAPHEVERRLREYRALLANDSVGILVVCDGNIAQCNSSAARLFGWEVADLLGRSAAVFFGSDEEFQSFASRIGDALAADGSPAVEWRTVRSNGSRVWTRLMVKSITPGGRRAKPCGWSMTRAQRDGSRTRESARRSGATACARHTTSSRGPTSGWSRSCMNAAKSKSVRRIALYDELTELPNRRLLESRLDEAIRNHQLGGDRLAVLVVDIDEFTKLNDALGHRVGDALLRATAARLVDTVRTSDLVARTGADEFAIVLGRLRHVDDAEHVAGKLAELLSEPFEIDAEQVNVSVSVGVAMFPSDGASPEMLLRNADAALSFAKSRGRGNVQLFEPRMNAEVVRRLQIEAGLRRGLEIGEFEAYYQPRIDLKDRKLVGAEALLRWRDPEHGLLEPGSFIAVAEDTGLIVPIGEIVLREACRAAMQWTAAGLGKPVVSVNLSPREFRGRSLLPMVSQALTDSGLEAERLLVEITEASLMRDGAKAEQVLSGLHAMGVKIALDNFGTGYSSLSSLRRFPVDVIKIDGQFVRAGPSDPADCKIVAALTSLARGLGLHVVAEGVETREQLSFVTDCGCNEAQGFLLGRPLTSAGFVDFAKSLRK